MCYLHCYVPVFHWFGWATGTEYRSLEAGIGADDTIYVTHSTHDQAAVHDPGFPTVLTPTLLPVHGGPRMTSEMV